MSGSLTVVTNRTMSRYASSEPPEGYFEGLVELFGSVLPVSPEEYVEFCARHDTCFV